MAVNAVHRVVIHDKPPLIDPVFLRRPFSRAALGVAAISLLIQALALWQVLSGFGMVGSGFDHAAFALVALLWLALGVLVFLQRQGQRAGRMFLLSASAGSIFLSLGTLGGVSVLDAVAYAAGLLLFPPLLLAFTRAFGRLERWEPSEVLLYLPAVFMLAPVARDVAQRSTGIGLKLGLLLVAVYLLAAIGLAARAVFAPRSPEHTAQTRALLIGLVAGTLPGILIFVVPLALRTSLIVAINWLPPLILIFLLAMSYAVLLFEFTEADLLLRRGVVYGVLTLAIILVYGGLGVLLNVVRTSVTSPFGGVGFVVVTVLLGAAFGPITYGARRSVDWLLYGRRADRWEMLQGLSARLATVMQPDDLAAVLVRELTTDLHLRGAILLRRQDERFVPWAAAGSVQVEAVPDLSTEQVEGALQPDFGWLVLVHARPLDSGHCEVVPARFRPLDALRAALTIPLITRSGLDAVLCLQSKLAHDAFDGDDLELLAPVIRQAAAALDNALLFSRLEEKVEELRQAYVHIARGQEAERARLARELHDGTAQELAGLITLATVVERQMQEQSNAALVTLDRLRRQAEEAYQGVRRASHALRPLMLDDFGLVPTLGRYLDQFSVATGIGVEYRADELPALSDDVELAFFRVAQECMENVRKHSGSTVACVMLQHDAGHVSLTVSDRGRGLPAAVGGRGMGLAGMRERIEAVGGVVRISNEPGAGVTVTAVVKSV